MKDAFSVAEAKARLSKKYAKGFSGKKYNELISQIVTENNTKIANTVLKKDKRKFKINLAVLEPKTSRGKKINLNLINEIDLVKNSPSIIKAAEKGLLLTKNLRNGLKRDIKKVLMAEGITTKRGTVNKNIEKRLRKEIVKRFENYTKKDPKFGMPKNINAIATTESRTVINNIRREYTAQIVRQSKSELVVFKKWIQNKSLSKGGKFRKDHEAMSDLPAIPFSDKYNLNGHSIDGAHDPSLPPSEVINCHCEEKYFFRKKD